MVVDSLITSISKYFSTLSVGSIFGDSKVSLVMLESGGDYEGRHVVIDDSDAKLFKESVFELDATESVTVNSSKKSLKHESESHQVFIDGVKVNLTRVTIVGHIDATKIITLEKFSKPNVLMHLLHTKTMGGSIAELGNYIDAKTYHILTVVTTDIGYKNTVKVQIELEEVVLYKMGVTSRTRVKQTNRVSGNNTSKPAVKEKVYLPTYPNK